MFEWSLYPIATGVLGAGVILAYWLPRFVSGREPAASTLLMAAGLVAGMILPSLAQHVDPVRHASLWEHTSELALIVGLFATGLRIDSLGDWRQWKPTSRLLVIGMPATILAVAVLGAGIAGMTLAGAILLGAVLAPTDPVLAGDVQVGRPLEGGEHAVRFTLTTEAGLNDGLAFPFVHLALAVATAGAITSEVAVHWLTVDVLYRIAVGVASGWAIGWLLGRIMFDYPRESPLARTEAGVVAVAGVLVCYGLTETLEGYGFIASFVAGLALRRSEAKHDFHRTMHSFTDTMEHVLTDVLLLAIGISLPGLWPALGWEGVGIGLLLVFFVRPMIGWFALRDTVLVGRQRIVVAFYGVRGIGSIFYVAYASSRLEMIDEARLWAIVVFVISISTIVHGLTAGLAVERVTGEPLKPKKAG